MIGLPLIFKGMLNPRQIMVLPEFRKFITASTTGRRSMPSGKKIRKGTITQYECVYQLLEEFEKEQEEPIRIQLLHRSSMRVLQKEKNYWTRFYRKFSTFLYAKKKHYDQYVGTVFKTLKTFFHYLSQEKAYPVGEFHKKFRVPADKFNPVILTPAQLKYLITDKAFEESLPEHLRRTKDIFVFGCTVALRFQDLMQLRKTNLQYTGESVNVVLHTQKTGAEIRIPLPDYAIAIIDKYKRKAGNYVLPRLSGTNLNLQVKAVMKKAGWDYHLPKIRQRQGEPVEIKTKSGSSFSFCDHITVHTMRRTAITTLLLMGLDETSVRKISGHAAGSKEFYRYVAVVQEYMDARVKQAHQKLLSETEPIALKIA